MKILRFNSAFTVSFHSSVKFDSGMTNHNALLCIATNEIASFCIDNGLHQMAFFVFAEVDKGQLSSNWERFWNKKAVFSLFAVTHLAIALCATLYFSYHILTPSVIYFWTHAEQHGIYLLSVIYPDLLGSALSSPIW